jgi:hypothetical protein
VLKIEEFCGRRRSAMEGNSRDVIVGIERELKREKSLGKGEME